MHMAVHRHPAIAFGVFASGVELPGGHDKGLNEGWIMHQPLLIQTLPMETMAPIPSLRPSRRLGRWLALVGAAWLATSQAGLAQERMAGSCPLVVAPSNSQLQPRRIPPSQVAGKNAGGCLSPSDAIYGPDGCPLKLCGANAGVIPLPAP
jgi:hypothetical protein